MGLLDIFKFDFFKEEETPFVEYLAHLRTALGAGAISEETRLLAALRTVFGFPDFHDSDHTVAILSIVEKHGPDFAFPVRSVRELLWLMERLERAHGRQRQMELRNKCSARAGQRTMNP